MAVDRLQKQRFELKYVIEEDTAQQLRLFVSEYLDTDEFSVGRPNMSYAVNSLYLDGDGMNTFWEWVNANRNRYKLRIRFYSENPEAPAFFELKRRVSNNILKERCGVKQKAVAPILAGLLPDSADMVSKDPKHLVALQNFLRVAQSINARPRMLVTYLREAYLDLETNSVRVTFDRQVRMTPRNNLSFNLQMDEFAQPFGNKVILEIKFTNRFPDWLGEMVRIYELRRDGAAKYCEGIASFFRPQFSNWREIPVQRPDFFGVT